MSRHYITTAIDYPNAAPHMGHALEKILADIVARWFRLKGDEVRFQIGTDEHGIKIQQTADKEKMTPKALVDRNVPLFQELYEKLGISADVFIRTSDQKMHWPTVQELWKRLEKAKMLEKRTYTGLYCSGCERFLTKKDLVDGVCDIHKVAPQEVKEENWFFKLSEETAWLKKLLKKDYKIIPSFRENETMALLESGLEDVSFSRPKTSLAWGIPVPGDEAQTMYVWCDALTNYISGLDYFGLNEDGPIDSAALRSGSFDSEKVVKRQSREDHERRSKSGVEWWNQATVTHVIGKDIARFHALIWPAMLKHSGVRVPDQLLIHGFLTSEGQKMSKSLGNVVKPEEVLAHFHGNADPLRFYLSHEVAVGNDGDFSWKRIDELYTSKLGNQLGNMLNRVLVMLKKENVDLQIPSDKENISKITKQWKEFGEKLDAFDCSVALQQIMSDVDAMNGAFNDAQPWKLEGAKKIETLSSFAESLRHAALMLLPFIPETAQNMSTQLGVPYAGDMLKKDFVLTKEMKAWGGIKTWKKTGEPSILFPPLEKPAA